MIKLNNTDKSLINLTKIDTTRCIKDELRIEVLIEGERFSFNYTDLSVMESDYSLLINKLMDESEIPYMSREKVLAMHGIPEY